MPVASGGALGAASRRRGAVAGLLPVELPRPGVRRALRGLQEDQPDGGHHPGDAPPRPPRLLGRGEKASNAHRFLPGSSQARGSLLFGLRCTTMRLGELV
jgi:hypothetical protein